MDALGKGASQGLYAGYRFRKIFKHGRLLYLIVAVIKSQCFLCESNLFKGAWTLARKFPLVLSQAEHLDLLVLHNGDSSPGAANLQTIGAGALT